LRFANNGTYYHAIGFGDSQTDFLVRRKRKVFDKVFTVGRAGDFIAGARDTAIASRLFGAEISDEQFDPRQTRLDVRRSVDR